MPPVRIVRALLVFSLTACNAATQPSAPPAFGQDARPAVASIVVDPSQRGAIVSPLVLGANMGTWYDLTQSNLAPAFRTAGMTATRWPGGSESDQYHWQTNSFGKHPCNKNAYINPHTTFDSFLQISSSRPSSTSPSRSTTVRIRRVRPARIRAKPPPG